MSSSSDSPATLGRPEVRGGPFAIDDELLGLRDAVAIVTGGAQSIGRGCAVALARAGCHVMIADLADGSDAVREIQALGRDAIFHRTDARTKTSVEEMVATTTAYFGRLDVAVNTVGSTKGPQPFLDIELHKLGPVERAVLRIATWELRERLDVPWRVVLDEAVSLTRKFGATDSHRFVNAVLDRVARELRPVEIRGGR